MTRYTAKHSQYLVTVTRVQLNLLATAACEVPCWIIPTALSLSTAVKRGIFLCAFSSCGTNVSVQPFYTVDLHVRTVLQTVPCFSRGTRFFRKLANFSGFHGGRRCIWDVGYVNMCFYASGIALHKNILTSVWCRFFCTLV